MSIDKTMRIGFWIVVAHNVLVGGMLALLVRFALTA